MVSREYFMVIRALSDQYKFPNNHNNQLKTEILQFTSGQIFTHSIMIVK